MSHTHRPFWTWLHRWAGLALALFVGLAGVTGSLLAFGPELERAISPQLFPPVPASGVPLDIGELLERAEALVPQAQADGVYLGDAERARVNMGPRPTAAGQPGSALGFNELFLHPYSGAELGRSTWGAISQGWFNLMPLVLEIHCSLVMGSLGVWVMGVAAVVWTLDCFVGFYLTLPNLRTGPGWRHWWGRWRPAWRIKRGSSAYRLQFDLHRAGGLWLWGLLFVFAWSSVFMNLGNQVYYPVMRQLFSVQTPDTALPLLETPLATPRLGWREAHARAQALMAEQARLHGFRVRAPVRMYLERERGVYLYDVQSSLDFQDRRGATTIYFDANTGELRLLLLPRGQHSGNTVTNWLLALHEANVFGLAYRVVVAELGLAVLGLSVTGVLVWLKKRRARLHGAGQFPEAGLRTRQ